MLPILKLCIIGMGFEIIFPCPNSNFISLSASWLHLKLWGLNPHFYLLACHVLQVSPPWWILIHLEQQTIIKNSFHKFLLLTILYHSRKVINAGSFSYASSIKGTTIILWGLQVVFEGNRKIRNYIVFFFHRTVLFSFLYQDGMTVTVKLFDISSSVLFLERTLQPLSC